MTMPDNPVLAAIRQRRSVRKYTGEPVTREQCEAILEAGRWAPTGLNNQPVRFLALWPDDPRVAALTDCTRYAVIVRDAALLVAVFLERAAMYHEMKDHQASGATIQNMLLAAHSLGLGAVWLGEIVNQADQVLDVLSLDPTAHDFMALVAVGQPAHAGASSRHPLSHFMLEEF